MTHVSVKLDLTACPACGSVEIACLVPRHIELDGCISCLKFWERLPAGEPYTTDGEQMPFTKPCNNCAFRGKSPERQDADTWESLMLSLMNGGEFYCHKAVPFAYTPGEPVQVLKEFEFPKIEKTVKLPIGTLKGVSHRYQGYDTERMRLCRSFLNQFVVPIARLEKAYVSDGVDEHADKP